MCVCYVIYLFTLENYLVSNGEREHLNFAGSPIAENVKWVLVTTSDADGMTTEENINGARIEKIYVI